MTSQHRVAQPRAGGFPDLAVNRSHQEHWELEIPFEGATLPSLRTPRDGGRVWDPGRDKVEPKVLQPGRGENNYKGAPPVTVDLYRVGGTSHPPSRRTGLVCSEADGAVPRTATRWRPHQRPGPRVSACEWAPRGGGRLEGIQERGECGEGVHQGREEEVEGAWRDVGVAMKGRDRREGHSGVWAWQRVRHGVG